MVNLLISEKIYLLSIDEKTGRFYHPSIDDSLNLALAGGLLISLMEENKIGFDGKHIVLYDPSSTDEPLLNTVLELIINSLDAKSINFWLHQILAEIKDLDQIILNRLIERKILVKHEKCSKYGNTCTYGLTDPKFKQKLIPKLKEYLVGDKRPSFPYRGLLCLIGSCGYYRIFENMNLSNCKQQFANYKYYSNLRAKKFYFLAKLKDEISAKHRMSVFL